MTCGKKIRMSRPKRPVAFIKRVTGNKEDQAPLYMCAVSLAEKNELEFTGRFGFERQ
jgi:hypothetical protein